MQQNTIIIILVCCSSGSSSCCCCRLTEHKIPGLKMLDTKLKRNIARCDNAGHAFDLFRVAAGRNSVKNDLLS